MIDLKTFIARRVLVFTDFMTFDGTVERCSRDGSTVVLSDVSAVADDGGRRVIDGEVVIPAIQVQWVQVP